MGVLRFPNPVSDIKKFWETYKLIHDDLKNTDDFDNYKIRRAMIDRGLVSSCGAVGEEALTRSTRDDPSRDPLYNQAKMYSEIYRVLGWIHPGSNRTHFVTTALGEYVSEKDNWSAAQPLVEQCVLHIAYPNPNVTTRSDNMVRPFPLLLRLMKASGGMLLRDEIIVGVLCVEDDRRSGALQASVELIQGLRGDIRRLRYELSTRAGSLQENTLQNYTRFPLGMLKTAGWAEPVRDRGPYDTPLTTYKMTPRGRDVVAALSDIVDIRASDLVDFSPEERLSFSLYSNYAFLKRAGYRLDSVLSELGALEKTCAPILKKFGINSVEKVMFSPYQQNSRQEIAAADKYEIDKFGE